MYGLTSYDLPEVLLGSYLLTLHELQTGLAEAKPLPVISFHSAQSGSEGLPHHTFPLAPQQPPDANVTISVFTIKSHEPSIGECLHHLPPQRFSINSAIESASCVLPWA